MKYTISTILLTLSIGTLLVCTCAQRDNPFDPDSILYKTVQPNLDVSITNIDKSIVIKSSGDTQFVVIPPAKISFTAIGYDVENKDSLSVFLEIWQNGKRVDIQDSISTVHAVLNDSGSRVFKFKVEGHNKQTTVKSFEFIISPDVQPDIKLFHTFFDTVRVGKRIDALFTLNVLDRALLLDSVKYVYMSSRQSKRVESSESYFKDTVLLSLFSRDTGVTEVLAIVVDKLGRTDTSSVFIAFNTTGKIGNLIPPIIQKIDVTSNNDSTGFWFNPEVTISNGNPDKVRYYWSFNDGRSESRDREPYRSFGIAGKYTIVLSVEDEFGLVSRDSVLVVVSKSSVMYPQIRSLLVKPKSGSAPLKVNFDCDIISDRKMVKRVTWIFGDGKSKITTRNFSVDHLYDLLGTYYPQVIVCNDAGCDTISDTVIVEGSNYLKALPSDNGNVGDKIKFYLDGFRPKNFNYIWSIQDSIIQTNKSECEYVFTKSGQYKIVVSSVNERAPHKQSVKIGELIYTVNDK